MADDCACSSLPLCLVHGVNQAQVERLPRTRLACAQGWVERDGRHLDDEGGADEDADLDEDEEYLSRAERFEADYNFRFQARYTGAPLM